MTAQPSVADLAERLGVPPADPRLPGFLAAALLVQSRVCETDPYDEGLREAALRRAAFLWASTAHTLGALDTGTDYGVQYLPMYHPDWDLLEIGRRVVVVA